MTWNRGRSPERLRVMCLEASGFYLRLVCAHEAIQKVQAGGMRSIQIEPSVASRYFSYLPSHLVRARISTASNLWNKRNIKA
jgi:hypothetical protein